MIGEVFLKYKRDEKLGKTFGIALDPIYSCLELTDDTAKRGLCAQ